MTLIAAEYALSTNSETVVDHAKIRLTAMESWTADGGTEPHAVALETHTGVFRPISGTLPTFLQGNSY